MSSPEIFGSVPEHKRPAVERALRTAFGSVGLDECRPLAGGLSTALVFRIVVGGKPYVLRVITSTQAVHDPTRQIECMRAAAGQRVAPALRYAHIDDRVLITDFIEGRPLPPDPLPYFVATLRTVHALPPFPRAFDWLAVADRYFQRFTDAAILPVALNRELIERYRPVVEAYPIDDGQMVSCHNDFKPDNTVFDGERVWLIDWEAACLNDRYVDLAVVANFFTADESTAGAYLDAYFGEPSGQYRRARFFLMRIITHLFYTTLLSTIPGVTIDLAAPAPDFRRFHEGLLSGEVTLTSPAAKAQYARIHLERALEAMRSERLAEALAVVGA